MTLNKNYVLKDYAGETVLVYQDETKVDFSRLIHINEVGKVIYQALSEGKELDEIVIAILNEYEVSTEVATKDALSFISKLKELGIVNE